MDTKTIKSIQRVYDETLRAIGLRQLRESHWDDQNLMKVLDEIEPNDSSLEKLQYKRSCLELIMRGEDHAITVI